MHSVTYDTAILRTMMAVKGLNPKTLGEAAEVHPTTVEKILSTGKGRASKVYAVAAALGVNVKPDDLSILNPRIKKVRVNNGNGRKGAA